MLNEKQIGRMLLKLKRFEDTLDGLMFEKVGEIQNASYFQTKEQFHEIPTKEPFQPLKKGEVWEGEATYCWVKGNIGVEKELDGKDLFIMPKMGGYEAMLWVNGVPFGTFATKIVYTGHGNHYCDLIKKDVKAGENIEIAIEFYAGHYVMGCMPFETNPKPDYINTVESIDICVKNDLVAKVMYDLKTVNQLVEALPVSSFRRADIINTLTEVHKVTYYSPGNIDKETFENSLIKIEGILAPKLENENSDTAPFVGLIGHSHMDTAWLWPIKETVKKCARTFANQMSLMEQYPEYKFIQSSAYHGEMIRENYPALFEQLQEKVKEGRYEPNGGVWVECDCNIVSGESMIRQFVWGQKFTQKHFDYTSNSFWLPDTFGYSPSIPHILKGCDINYFLTTKMAWNDTNMFPYDSFYWQGIDGTKVFTHFNKTHVWPDPKTMIDLVEGTTGDCIKQKTVSDKKLVSYGFGDGGGGPEDGMIEMSRRCKDLEGCPKSEHMLVGDFMKLIEETAQNPSTYSGELYLELHRGTLTNQHEIKRNNRKAEVKLHDLEYLTVCEAVKNEEIASDSNIRPLYNTLLVNQFHDILPGTCIPSAHIQSKAEMTDVINNATKIIRETVNPDKKEDAISIINTLSFERNDVVYIDYKDGIIVEGNYKQQVISDTNGNKKLAVYGVTIPAFSSVVLNLIKGEVDNKSEFVCDGDKLSTPFAEITFDEKGYISSFIDKEANRELKGEGYNLNTFLVAEDVPYQWDNWDVDADIEMKFEDQAKLISREVVSSGEVEYRIRSKYQITKLSTIEQDMIFYANCKEVRFETKINWQDEHRFLKTAFDTTIFSDFVRQELQFGYTKRPTTRNNSFEQAKFEVCNHKYTDLSDQKYGVSILNDCKYGISVYGSQLRLSLHKGGVRPDFNGDKGIHECTYSFLPHNGGFDTTNVIKPAYELNMKSVIVDGEYDIKSMIEVDAENVIIETIKPCEDNEKAFIARIYEAEGAYTNTKLNVNINAIKVYETNMLEEKSVELNSLKDISLTFRPFEIKTIKVVY